MARGSSTSVVANSLSDLTENPIVNLMGEVNRFLDGLACGHHPNIDLPLSRQPSISSVRATQKSSSSAAGYKHLGHR